MGTYTCRHTGKTRVRMVEASDKVPIWREAVKTAALAVRNGAAALDGPLVGSVTFTMARPKKPRFQHPATAPDLSKLLRSTEDALKDAGVIADDARIVRYRDLAKVFIGHPDALDAPGCLIVIEPLQLQELAKPVQRQATAQLFPLTPPREPF